MKEISRLRRRDGFRDGQFIAEREVSSLDEDSTLYGEMMVGRKQNGPISTSIRRPGAVRLRRLELVA